MKHTKGFAIVVIAIDVLFIGIQCEKETLTQKKSQSKTDIITKGGGSGFTAPPKGVYYVSVNGDNLAETWHDNTTHPAYQYPMTQDDWKAKHNLDSTLHHTDSMLRPKYWTRFPKAVISRIQAHALDTVGAVRIFEAIAGQDPTTGGSGYNHHITIRYDLRWPNINGQMDVYWNTDSYNRITGAYVHTDVWGTGVYKDYTDIHFQAADGTVITPYVHWTQQADGRATIWWDAEGRVNTGWAGSSGWMDNVIYYNYIGIINTMQDGSTIIDEHSACGTHVKEKTNDFNGLR